MRLKALSATTAVMALSAILIVATLFTMWKPHQFLPGNSVGIQVEHIPDGATADDIISSFRLATNNNGTFIKKNPYAGSDDSYFYITGLPEKPEFTKNYFSRYFHPEFSQLDPESPLDLGGYYTFYGDSSYAVDTLYNSGISASLESNQSRTFLLEKALTFHIPESLVLMILLITLVFFYLGAEQSRVARILANNGWSRSHIRRTVFLRAATPAAVTTSVILVAATMVVLWYSRGADYLAWLTTVLISTVVIGSLAFICTAGGIARVLTPEDDQSHDQSGTTSLTLLQWSGAVMIALAVLSSVTLGNLPAQAKAYADSRATMDFWESATQRSEFHLSAGVLSLSPDEQDKETARSARFLRMLIADGDAELRSPSEHRSSDSSLPVLIADRSVLSDIPLADRQVPDLRPFLLVPSSLNDATVVRELEASTSEYLEFQDSLGAPASLGLGKSLIYPSAEIPTYQAGFESVTEDSATLTRAVELDPVVLVVSPGDLSDDAISSSASRGEVMSLLTPADTMERVRASDTTQISRVVPVADRPLEMIHQAKVKIAWSSVLLSVSLLITVLATVIFLSVYQARHGHRRAVLLTNGWSTLSTDRGIYVVFLASTTTAALLGLGLHRTWTAAGVAVLVGAIQWLIFRTLLRQRRYLSSSLRR